MYQHFCNCLQGAYQIDRFASRGGGVRSPSQGRDSALRHYLPKLSPSILKVFHVDYNAEAEGDLVICKALSSVLCENSLTSNANKCILVKREAALFAFGSNYTGRIMAQCALAASQGIEDAQQIAERLGDSATQGGDHVQKLKDLLKDL